MPHLVSCSCGKKWKVRDELAGKKVKCPACASVLVVPAVEIVAAEEAVQAEKPRVVPPPLPPSESEEPEEKPARPRAAEKRGSSSIWRCTHGSLYPLLVFGDEGLCTMNFPKSKDRDFAEEELEEGQPPEDALGEGMILLPYEKISLFSANKHHPGMEVTFKGKDENGADTDVTETFTFESPKEKDRAMKALRERLEPGWKYSRHDYTRLEAAVQPLITIGVIVLITGALAGLAYWLSFWTGSARVPSIVAFLYHVVMWLGHSGVILIGAGIVVLCIIWLVVRVSTPPIMLTLKPKKNKGLEED